MIVNKKLEAALNLIPFANKPFRAMQTSDFTSGYEDGAEFVSQGPGKGATPKLNDNGRKLLNVNVSSLADNEDDQQVAALLLFLVARGHNHVYDKGESRIFTPARAVNMIASVNKLSDLQITGNGSWVVLDPKTDTEKLVYGIRLTDDEGEEWVFELGPSRADLVNRVGAGLAFVSHLAHRAY